MSPVVRRTRTSTGTIDSTVSLGRSRSRPAASAAISLVDEGAPVQCVWVSPMSTAMTLATPSYADVANGVRRGPEASGQP